MERAAAWADWMARHTLSGVAGMEMSSTPSSDSASTMALITAGGEPMAPISPQPLTPSVLWAQSVVWVPTLISGRSSARGMQ